MKGSFLSLSATLGLSLAAFNAQALDLFSNLGEVWTQPGIGEIRSPGGGFGSGTVFSTADGYYSVDSVTLEQFLFDPAGQPSFELRLYKLDSLGGLTLAGQLANPIPAPGETQWPGLTSFVVYTPTAPVTLEPSSQYLVAVFQAADSTGAAQVLFTQSPGFSALPGWGLGPDYFGFTIGTMEVWGVTTLPGHLKFKVAGSESAEPPPVNHPPDVSAAAASAPVLWPPNGKMVPIQITGVTDPDGDPLSISIVAVQQDEPVVGPGDKTAPDAFVNGSDTALVRAERLGNRNGRVYAIHFSVTDGKPAGTATGVVYVGVPHDAGSKGGAINDGPLTGYFNSTAP